MSVSVIATMDRASGYVPSCQIEDSSSRTVRCSPTWNADRAAMKKDRKKGVDAQLNSPQHSCESKRTLRVRCSH